MASKNCEKKDTRWKFNGVGGLALFIFLGFLVTASGQENGHNSQKIYEADIPKDKEQEISIHIGAKGQGAGVGINNDDDSGGSSNSTGSVSKSESTYWEKCNSARSMCCYQYTWSGYQEKIPEAANATCEYLKKERKDDTVACHDPMVYTQAIDGQEIIGNPPNFDELVARSRRNKWPIYCVMSGGKSCISYTHYSGSKMVNQTKFCGFVTNINTSNNVKSGCFKQTVGGFLREVCVCDGHLCNKESSASSLSNPSSKLIWTTIISFIVYASTVYYP